MAHFTFSMTVINGRRLAAQIGSVSLLSLGSLTALAPAQAISFQSWGSIGDVTADRTTLTTSFDANDDNSVNFNQSGTSAADINALEIFVFGSATSGLGAASQEGSAIAETLTVNAGAIFSFDWNFLTNEPENNPNLDFPFIAIGNDVEDLVVISDATISPAPLNFSRQTGLNTYSYTFPTAGTFRIAIGVVDDTDFNTTSALVLANPSLSVIPTPALLPGLIGFGVAAWRRRKAQ